MHPWVTTNIMCSRVFCRDFPIAHWALQPSDLVWVVEGGNEGGGRVFLYSLILKSLFESLLLVSGNLTTHPGSDLPLHSPQNLNHAILKCGQTQHEHMVTALHSHHHGWRGSFIHVSEVGGISFI